MLDKLITCIVCWYKTVYQILRVSWTNRITTRRFRNYLVSDRRLLLISKENLHMYSVLVQNFVSGRARIFIGYREPSNLQLTCLKECYIPTPNAIVFKKIWLTQIFPTMNLTLTTYLGDNSLKTYFS
jgi:hypothetical protein